MADEPDNLTLRILREIRENMATKDDLTRAVAGVNARIDGVDARIDGVNDRIDGLGCAVAADIHDLAGGIHNLNAKIDGTRADLSAQIGTLREAVTHYHSSVIGHGVIISELEARVSRIERHLHIDPDN